MTEMPARATAERDLAERVADLTRQLAEARESARAAWDAAANAAEPLIVYGPHCSHDECS